MAKSLNSQITDERHSLPDIWPPIVPNQIYVGGISGDIKEEDLINFFSNFGKVKSAKIIFYEAGESKGYGFVTFETAEEARKVAPLFDFVTLKGQKLKISWANKPFSRNAVVPVSCFYMVNS